MKPAGMEAGRPGTEDDGTAPRGPNGIREDEGGTLKREEDPLETEQDELERSSWWRGSRAGRSTDWWGGAGEQVAEQEEEAVGDSCALRRW